jgi:aspartate aminotransferase, mitochondrial
MGLYGERIGLLHVVCSSESRKAAVLSQLKILARAMYSNPPIHGALLVKTVLSDEALVEEWKGELKQMAGRIKGLRQTLREGLEKKNAPMLPDWSHITRQIGMFSFTGLSPKQCDALIQEHHIYLMRSGRISVAGLNAENVDYVVDCFDQVLRNVPAE